MHNTSEYYEQIWITDTWNNSAYTFLLLCVKTYKFKGYEMKLRRMKLLLFSIPDKREENFLVIKQNSSIRLVRDWFIIIYGRYNSFVFHFTFCPYTKSVKLQNLLMVTQCMRIIIFFCYLQIYNTLYYRTNSTVKVYFIQLIQLCALM